MAVADMYALGLRAAGFNVAAFPDLDSFFKALEVAVPDMVVLDWNLPQGTGGDALARLRRESRTARVLVMILSNFDPDQLVGTDAVLEAGDVAWLVKGRTTAGQLAEKVRKELGADLSAV